MFYCKQEKLDEKNVKLLAADLSEHNEYICETAGFVPLEVKLKQFEQNGLIAQFMVSDFDSHDYRDIYLNPDFNVNPEDDFEDIQEKLAARNEFIEQLKSKKAASIEAANPGEARSTAAAVETKRKASVDTEEEVTSKD